MTISKGNFKEINKMSSKSDFPGDSPLPPPNEKIAEFPRAAEPRPRLVFETIADLRSGEEEEYLIEGFVPEKSVGLFWGRWGSFKTFAAFDWALHLAYGFGSWHGAKLPGEPCDVLIIAREGRKGFVKRIDAFKKHHGIAEDTECLTFMRSAISFLDDFWVCPNEKRHPCHWQEFPARPYRHRGTGSAGRGYGQGAADNAVHGTAATDWRAYGRGRYRCPPRTFTIQTSSSPSLIVSPSKRPLPRAFLKFLLQGAALGHARLAIAAVDKLPLMNRPGICEPCGADRRSVAADFVLDAALDDRFVNRVPD